MSDFNRRSVLKAGLGGAALLAGPGIVPVRAAEWTNVPEPIQRFKYRGPDADGSRDTAPGRKSFPMASHGIVTHCECCTLYFWSADLPPNGEAFRRHYLTCSQSSRSSTCQRNTCCPAIRSEVACEKCWSEH